MDNTVGIRTYRVDEIVLKIIVIEFILILVKYELMLRLLEKNAFFNKKEEEWVGRIVSSIHAIVVTTMFVVFYFKYPQFSVEHDLFYSPFNCTVFICFSLAYFLVDLLMIVTKNFEKNKLHIPHHVVAILSILLGLLNDEYYLGMMMLLCMEGSTPFINNIFFLKELNLKNSVLYVINGILLLVTWIFFRFVAGIGYFFYLMYVNWERYKQKPFLGCYWIFMQLVFMTLNIYWFSKILRGFMKMFTKNKKL